MYTCSVNFLTCVCIYVINIYSINFLNWMVSVTTVKVCDKKFILKEKKSEYIMREKTVLTKTNHPFIIKLFYTFQDTDRLCILHCYCYSVSFYPGYISYLYVIYECLFWYDNISSHTLFESNGFFAWVVCFLPSWFRISYELNTGQKDGMVCKQRLANVGRKNMISGHDVLPLTCKTPYFFFFYSSCTFNRCHFGYWFHVHEFCNTCFFISVWTGCYRCGENCVRNANRLSFGNDATLKFCVYVWVCVCMYVLVCSTLQFFDMHHCGNVQTNYV